MDGHRYLLFGTRCDVNERGITAVSPPRLQKILRRSATATLYPSAGLLYDGHLAGYRRSSPARLLAVEARSRSSACGKTGENEMVVVVQSVAETPCLAYCLGRCLAPIPSVPRLSSQSCPLSWRCHGFSRNCLGVSEPRARDNETVSRSDIHVLACAVAGRPQLAPKVTAGRRDLRAANGHGGGGGPSVRFRSIPTVRIVTDAGHFGCSGPRLCENYHIEKMYKMQFLETGVGHHVVSIISLRGDAIASRFSVSQKASEFSHGLDPFPTSQRCRGGRLHGMRVSGHEGGRGFVGASSMKKI